jgi:hypothetical protein
MMTNKVDAELCKNKRFIDRVELLIMCYIKLIRVVQESKRSNAKMEETRQHALRIAVRFLGEGHSLTKKFG